MNYKKILSGVLVSGMLLTGIVAYADSSNSNTSTSTGKITTSSRAFTPGRGYGMRFGKEGNNVQVLANLLGKPLEDTYKLLTPGKTLAEIAQENGISLDKFQQAMLESRKNIIQQRVKDGTITQEQADLMIKNMEQNIKNCDGTGIGRGMGRGSGMDRGFGMGR